MRTFGLDWGKKQIWRKVLGAYVCTYVPFFSLSTPSRPLLGADPCDGVGLEVALLPLFAGVVDAACCAFFSRSLSISFFLHGQPLRCAKSCESYRRIASENYRSDSNH